MRLFREFQKNLDEITISNSTWLQRAEAGITISKTFINKLREEAPTSFETIEEEINFHKQVKPMFSAYLVYYTDVYNIELGRPMGTIPQQENYLQEEYQRIITHTQYHHEFYKYYKSGRSDLDQQYFVHNTLFSIAYDQLIARFKANEMLCEYIGESIAALNNRNSSINYHVTWTAPAVGLAELAIALDAHCVCNGASIGMGRMAQLLSSVFNVRINNIYKQYEEIKYRKKTNTPFLDSLKNSLQKKIENDD